MRHIVAPLVLLSVVEYGVRGVLACENRDTAWIGSKSRIAQPGRRACVIARRSTSVPCPRSSLTDTGDAAGVRAIMDTDVATGLEEGEELLGTVNISTEEITEFFAEPS